MWEDAKNINEKFVWTGETKTPRNPRCRFERNLRQFKQTKVTRLRFLLINTNYQFWKSLKVHFSSLAEVEGTWLWWLFCCWWWFWLRSKGVAEFVDMCKQILGRRRSKQEIPRTRWSRHKIFIATNTNICPHTDYIFVIQTRICCRIKYMFQFDWKTELKGVQHWFNHMRG